MVVEAVKWAAIIAAMGVLAIAIFLIREFRKWDR